MLFSKKIKKNFFVDKKADFSIIILYLIYARAWKRVKILSKKFVKSCLHDKISGYI